MKLRFLWVSSFCTCLKAETTHEPENFKVQRTPPQELSVTIVQSSPEKQSMCQANNAELPIVHTAFSPYFQLKVAAVSGEMGPQGLVRYQSGAEYRGGWDGGERNGEGEMRWSADTWYKGFWRDGMPADYGTMQIRPGVKFEGEWTRRFYTPVIAKPVLLASFDQWLHAVDDGYGICYSVWLWYELQRGLLLQVLPEPPTNPTHLLTYVTDLTASVAEYLAIMDSCWKQVETDSHTCGEFLKMQFGSQLYTGCHNDKKPNGIGRLQLAPGCKYEGEWVNGERSGFGTYSWPSGKVVSGFWREGKPHGPCLTLDPKKDRELAVWGNGMKIQVVEIGESL